MRRLQNDGTPESLPVSEVAEIRRQHLPYRIALLQDTVGRIPAKTMADNQAFEAGTVAGRSLLSFLGVGCDSKHLTLKPERTYRREKGDVTDEVKAPDVGGRFVDIASLTANQKNIIARFIHGAHKACAHFTWRSNHSLDVETYKDAARLISDLFELHVTNAGSGVSATPP